MQRTQRRRLRAAFVALEIFDQFVDVRITSPGALAVIFEMMLPNEREIAGSTTQGSPQPT